MALKPNKVKLHHRHFHPLLSLQFHSQLENIQGDIACVFQTLLLLFKLSISCQNSGCSASMGRNSDHFAGTAGTAGIF